MWGGVVPAFSSACTGASSNVPAKPRLSPESLPGGLRARVRKTRWSGSVPLWEAIWGWSASCGRGVTGSSKSVSVHFFLVYILRARRDREQQACSVHLFLLCILRARRDRVQESWFSTFVLPFPLGLARVSRHLYLRLARVSRISTRIFKKAVSVWAFQG